MPANVLGRGSGISENKKAKFGKFETVADCPYYFADTIGRFCNVSDESISYEKYTRLTIINNADRWFVL